MAQTIIFWFAAFFAVICLVTSLLPYVPAAHGIFRVFEFPRLQSAWISGTTFVVLLIFLPWQGWTLLLAAMLATAFLIQAWHIARFTPLWKQRSYSFDGDRSAASVVRLLVANVKLSNRDYGPLQQLVSEKAPDIAVFIEVDEDWIEALDTVVSGYEFRMDYPQDNGYGLSLVSRFPLRDEEIRFLLNPEVPSFDMRVDHPDGGTFRLLAVHPEPPIATHDTIGRDAELSRVAELARDDDEPIVVTGDLNDVAWSRTTRRFLRVSRLLDPREGRGHYNSFDARFWFLRWPLDHIFHSPHFKVIEINRLEHVGSDHFPMFYELALTDQERPRRDTDAADADDMQEVEELVEIEKKRDRRPVGVDWEDE